MTPSELAVAEDDVPVSFAHKAYLTTYNFMQNVFDQQVYAGGPGARVQTSMERSARWPN
jgi:hypothetical protein